MFPGADGRTSKTPTTKWVSDYYFLVFSLFFSFFFGIFHETNAASEAFNALRNQHRWIDANTDGPTPTDKRQHRLTNDNANGPTSTPMPMD